MPPRKIDSSPELHADDSECSDRNLLDDGEAERWHLLCRKLAAMYARGDMITVCALSYMEYESGRSRTVYHKIDGQWVPFTPVVEDYPNYSHGLSPQMAAIHYPEFWKRIVK